MSLSVTTISAGDLTQSHLELWAQLQSSCTSWNHPFLSATFAQAVQQIRGDVEVALFWQGSELRGFLPFHRVGRCGRPLGLFTSDLHSPIMARDTRLDPLAFLRGAGLKAWHFDHLVTEPSLFQRFVLAVDQAPYIDLADGFDTYRDHLKANGQTWDQAQRKLRKLERDHGPVHFFWHRPAAADLDSLITWKRQQIASTGDSATLQSEWVDNLFRHCALLDSPECHGVLSVLVAGTQTIAVHLGLNNQSMLTSWVPSYNPDFARYSPGLLLHLKLAEAAAERGLQRIDLGRGQNQMKRSLQSGALDLAIGSVDRQWLALLIRRPWYRLRAAAHHMPMAQKPLRWFRRYRSFLATTQREPQTTSKSI